MAVATLKAMLVVLFFMNMRFERRDNRLIFFSSFIFLGIFLSLTSFDLFYRGDVYVHGPLFLPSDQMVSKLKDPWKSTPELVKQGSEIYHVQCTSCHGVEGHGNGPAAAALNPPPRNFTQTQGWKNGRRSTMVFKTLKEGLPPSAMASYANLPPDDRWALAAFVLSIGGPVEADSPEDFAKAGIDPSKQGEAEKVAPSIPLSVALKLAALPETPVEKVAHRTAPSSAALDYSQAAPGARIYQVQCASCHGVRGEGGIKVQRLGELPVAYVKTFNLRESATLNVERDFNAIVVNGLPGTIMPGSGQLSSDDLRELYRYTQQLVASGQP